MFIQRLCYLLYQGGVRAEPLFKEPRAAHRRSAFLPVCVMFRKVCPEPQHFPGAVRWRRCASREHRKASRAPCSSCPVSLPAAETQESQTFSAFITAAQVTKFSIINICVCLKIKQISNAQTLCRHNYKYILFNEEWVYNGKCASVFLME